MASFIKTQYRKIRPTIRFVGRHFFTINTLIFMLCWVQPSTANWKNISVSLLVVIAFDWWKMKLKFNGGASQPFIDSIHTPTYRSDDNNPSVVGTPAWISKQI